MNGVNAASQTGCPSQRYVARNAISSVGTIVQSKVELAVQYPQGSASAVLLVLALVVGVFVITRFSNLREDV